MWHQVQKKCFRSLADKWDAFPFGEMRGCATEDVCLFYISHFPLRIKSRDIFELFACIGEVEEVVISPRRNKWGRRFGFARFSGVEDNIVLGVNLDNVMIDGSKLHANQCVFAVFGSLEESYVEGFNGD